MCWIAALKEQHKILMSGRGQSVGGRRLGRSRQGSPDLRVQIVVQNINPKT